MLSTQSTPFGRTYKTVHFFFFDKETFLHILSVYHFIKQIIFVLCIEQFRYIIVLQIGGLLMNRDTLKQIIYILTPLPNT